MSDPDRELVDAAATLATRFAAGATLWCVAPAWPEHGRHLAVEFVHPVVVGARSLPAVSVETVGPTARPGDVVALIGPADDDRLRDLAARAPADGLTTLWLVPDDNPLARHDGSLVLQYHLLWELVQLWLEHGAPAAAS